MKLLDLLNKQSREVDLILSKMQSLQFNSKKMNLAEDMAKYLENYDKARQAIVKTHEISLFDYELMFNYVTFNPRDTCPQIRNKMYNDLIKNGGLGHNL